MVGGFIARLVKWLEKYERKKKQEKKAKVPATQKQSPAAPQAPTTGVGQIQQRRQGEPQGDAPQTAELNAGGKQKVVPLGIKPSSRSAHQPHKAVL